MSFTDQYLKIITDPNLSPKQKSNYLSLEADSNIEYLPLSPDAIDAKKSGIICDMFEGHAPFKPRYVLPDYQKFLKNGSSYLELDPATTLDEALNCLNIIYHHVPSVTNIPVYLGQLDLLLLPFVGDLEYETIYKKLKLFWIMLDRTLPDAFMHANIGPRNNIICRIILEVDLELKQIAPNLTFLYDPKVTPDPLLDKAINNICLCNKPHVANIPAIESSFDGQGFAIVSCYNSLPLAGGANTLVRLNLKEVALKSTNIADFLDVQLPHFCSLVFEMIDVRSSFLHEKSNFFESFLVSEGLIEESRFVPMFGIYAMAEAVAILLEKDQISGLYGTDPIANDLAYKISSRLNEIVTRTPVKYGYKGRALLHSQGGLSCDKGTTPGIRIAYGDEPDPVTHIQALAPQHKFYNSGISDILSIDETVKANPEAMTQLCKGAFSLGFREFTANVANTDLVRITGYMVKMSDLKFFKQKGSRTNTTALAAEAVVETDVSKRQPRVISHEQSPCFDK